MITNKEIYDMGYSKEGIATLAEAILSEAEQDEIDEGYILEKVHAIEHFIQEITELKEKGMHHLASQYRRRKKCIICGKEVTAQYIPTEDHYKIKCGCVESITSSLVAKDWIREEVDNTADKQEQDTEDGIVIARIVDDEEKTRYW